MSTPQNIEDRLAILEREFAELKRRVEAKSSKNWLEKVSGSMKDFPEFKEVLRLGKEIRRARSPDSDTSE